MTRLLASTLVLAGAAWVSAGSLASDEQPVRHDAPRLEAARNQHGLKALALLFAADTNFLSLAATQVHWDISGETTPGKAANPACSSWTPLADARQNGPWLAASAHNTNLLANPPPR